MSFWPVGYYEYYRILGQVLQTAVYKSLGGRIYVGCGFI
jgi:hypothetical protein